MLSTIHRNHLLSIARESIAGVLQGRPLEIDLDQFDEPLRRPSGAFVSLHTLEGDLRGCIGSVHPVAPLCHAVSSSAVHAAFRDPRFHPMTRDELSLVRIEISVMSPVVPVVETEEIEVGTHGLIVRRGDRAGLLLPQVAIEYGWDRETFLEQTCRKAGLPSGSWQDPACRLERFSAEVFGETAVTLA